MSYQLVITIPIDQQMIDDAKKEFPEMSEQEALNMAAEEMKEDAVKEFGENASVSLKEVG